MTHFIQVSQTCSSDIEYIVAKRASLCHIYLAWLFVPDIPFLYLSITSGETDKSERDSSVLQNPYIPLYLLYATKINCTNIFFKPKQHC